MLYLYVHPDFNRALMEYMNRHALATVDAPQLPAPDLEVDYHVGNGDDVEHPETEIIDDEPESLPANGKEENDIPTSPKALLADVDAKIDGSYGNLPDLLLAIQSELGKGWNWPAAKDTDGWTEAREAAIKHAA